MRDKVIVITGASAGIGRAAAIEFGRRGARLGLCARREKNLAETERLALEAGAAGVTALTVDVRNLWDLEILAHRVREEQGPADVVVANAGRGMFGPLTATDVPEVEALVDTNVTGVVRTFKAFQAQLLETRGQLVVVSSVLGKVPMPYVAAYAATKHALTGFTRSLRPELRRHGVAVALVDPGATATEFNEAAHYAPGTSPVNRHLNAAVSVPAARVARRMAWAVRWRVSEMDLTLPGILGVAAAKVAPNLLARLAEPLMRPRRRSR